MEIPPSIIMVCPVILDDASDRRKIIALAISNGLAILLSGDFLLSFIKILDF